MQQEALWTAIASILWRIGECTQCFICLPQNEPIILSSTVFCSDGITEKLQIFEVLNLEDLHILIKRYLYLFQDKDGPGVLLLLYSAVITRGVERVLTDLNQERGQLLGGAEGGNICIVTLLLTGRATPYLHNGVVYMGDKDHYALPQFGVLSRGEVGLLMWEEGSNDSVQPGSRLKTPSLPVWVCLCAGQLGVLFSTNRELLRNYHAERRFNLHYYTLGGSNSLLNVDTRYGDDGSDALSKSTTPILPLEKLIHTKWQGAHITWIKSSPTM